MENSNVQNLTVRRAEAQQREAEEKVDSLHADFVPDTRGLYTGARCELQGGEVIEVKGRRTPLYDLARELEKRGYGEWRLESYTHTGTPSLRGLIKVMAELTVEESDKYGLRVRKYRPFPLGR